MKNVKYLTVVVKPFRAEEVLKTISELNVHSCTVREAKGYGRQKGYLDQYRGSEYSEAYLPKVEISVWVDEDRLDEVRETILKVARTGRIGDGKVFVVPTIEGGSFEF